MTTPDEKITPAGLSPRELKKYRADHIITVTSAPNCRISGVRPNLCPGCKMLAAIADFEARIQQLQKGA